MVKCNICLDTGQRYSGGVLGVCECQVVPAAAVVKPSRRGKDVSSEG